MARIRRTTIVAIDVVERWEFPENLVLELDTLQMSAQEWWSRPESKDPSWHAIRTHVPGIVLATRPRLSRS
jgi:hypothetical protein